MKWLLFLALVITVLNDDALASVRSVKLQPDQLLSVRTALGIATIIQTPTSIESAIIGDQSGFKVEYLDRAVTIKPLRYGAKTNLYLQTSQTRFSIKLDTVSHDRADFIIYIKDVNDLTSQSWRKLAKEVSTAGVALKLLRVARTANGVVLFDGLVTSEKSLDLSPEMFWLEQDAGPTVINSLILSSLKIRKSKSVRFGVSILEKDIALNKPVIFQLRLKKPLSVRLTEREWKN